MTAVTLYQVMNLITVNIATVSIVRSVRHTARNAMSHYVWDVLINVHHARNLSVSIALVNARNARKYIVWIV